MRQLLAMDGEAGAEAAIGTAPGAATAYRHEPAPGRDATSYRKLEKKQVVNGTSYTCKGAFDLCEA